MKMIFGSLIHHLAMFEQSRGSAVDTNTGDAEKEITVIQMLTEMDGFKQNEAVVVMAATNR